MADICTAVQTQKQTSFFYLSPLVNTTPTFLETYQNCLFSFSLKTIKKKKQPLQATPFKVILIFLVANYPVISYQAR